MIAKNPHRVVIVVWSNQSIHIVGDHAVLRYHAAAPGRWFRADARVLAGAVVGGLGGCAWDEQGTVTLAVPRGAARRADELMSALANNVRGGVPFDDQCRLANETALILDGGHAVGTTGYLTAAEVAAVIDVHPVQFRYSVASTEAAEGVSRRTTVTVTAVNAAPHSQFVAPSVETAYSVSSPWEVVAVLGATPADADAAAEAPQPTPTHYVGDE